MAVAQPGAPSDEDIAPALVTGSPAPRWRLHGPRLVATLALIALTGVVLFARHRAHPTLLLATPVAAADAQSPTFDALFPIGGWPEWAQVALWLGVAELLGIASFPLSFFVFPGLRDRGWALSKCLGLLLFGYLVWLSASLRLLPFERPTMLRVLVLLLLAGIGAGWRARRHIAALLRARWRLLLGGEIVFLAAFAVMALIRAADPNLWYISYSGEKPFELAFMDGIARSRYFPPLDPWHSGGYINYYYYGLYLVVLLAKLTGIPTPIAFNLALALLFALTCTGIFSVATSLTRRWWAGVAGAVAVAGIGNLEGMRQLAQQIAALANGQPAPAFNYFLSAHFVTNAINEFPYWSYIYGDLHPHVIAPTLTAFIIALGVSLVLGRTLVPGWRAATPSLAAGALALGALACTNTWDVPTYALLLAAALALRVLPALGEAGGRAWLARIRPRDLLDSGLALGFMLAASFALYLPYHLNAHVPVSGIAIADQHTVPWQYGYQFGLWLFILVSFLLVELRGRVARLAMQRGASASQAASMGNVAVGVALAALLVAVATGLLWMALAMVLLLGLLLALDPLHDDAKRLTYVLLVLGLAISLAVEWVYVKDSAAFTSLERSNTIFKFYMQVWMLFALAAAAALASLLGRLNLRASLVRKRRTEPAPRSGRLALWQPALALRVSWLLALAVLVCGSLIFDVEGTQARVSEPGRWAAKLPPPGGLHPNGLSLDGMAFMQGWYPDDYAAIRWLDAHITGTPIIMESVYVRPYGWQGRVSAYTGLPDVVAWGSHEGTERSGGAVTARVNDVVAFWSTTAPSTALAILHQYGVSYVYFGNFERECYTMTYQRACIPMSAPAMAKLAMLVGEGALRPVYDSAGVVIYAVSQSSAEQSLTAPLARVLPDPWKAWYASRHLG